jgi:chaperone required for assembly of F1-ATPase
MKRFYKQVAISPEAGGYAVRLDGRTVKTPGRNTLVVPAPALADAIAEEWRRQDEVIEPVSMLLTKFANTAIERVLPQRSEIVEELLKYGSGDLLCYRADDAALAERQRLSWDPVLDWLAQRHGARLVATIGVTHIAQPGEAILALGRALAPVDPFVLTGLHVATALTGSLALALALEDAHLDAAAAFEKAHLDERYQAEKWGRDSAAEARLESLAIELESAAKFMSLART